MRTDPNSYAIFVSDKKFLVIRERGRKLFGLPGGGIKSGESPETSLIRELNEELGINVSKANLKPVSVFWGLKNRTKRLKAECFLVKMDSKFNLGKEIEEILWVNSQNSKEYNLSWIIKNEVLPYLVRKGIII